MRTILTMKTGLSMMSEKEFRTLATGKYNSTGARLPQIQKYMGHYRRGKKRRKSNGSSICSAVTRQSYNFQPCQALYTCKSMTLAEHDGFRLKAACRVDALAIGLAFRRRAGR